MSDHVMEYGCPFPDFELDKEQVRSLEECFGTEEKMKVRKLNSEAESAVKDQMGYKGNEECCSVCDSFGESELIGGSNTDRPARCEYNAAFWIPVEEGGRCDFFSPRQSLYSTNEKCPECGAYFQYENGKYLSKRSHKKTCSHYTSEENS